MSEFLIVLAIALLPAGGSIIRSVIAESTRAPEWVIGSALHAAAGVAIRGCQRRSHAAYPGWDARPACNSGLPLRRRLFCAPGEGVKRLRPLIGAKGSAGAWMVYMAIAADLFSDGLMTGVGSAVSSALGLLLGLSQVVANIPGGFASMANFRSEGVARRTRIIIACSFALPLFYRSDCRI